MSVRGWTRLRGALALTGFVAVGVLQASGGEAASAPISILSEAWCDSANGQWRVEYLLENRSPGPVTILSAVDPETGDHFAPLTRRVAAGAQAPIADRGVYASESSVSLAVMVQRDDRTAAVRYDRVHPLPAGCAPAPSAPECASRADARYQHTFDGARGTATVEVVGKPLCVGVTQYVSLRTDHDSAGTTLTAARPKVSLAVNMLPCRTKVTAYFGSGADLGLPKAPYVLGGDAVPGSQSAGPPAEYVTTDPVCSAQPGAEVVGIRCDGTYQVLAWNGAAATTHALITVYERLPYDDRGDAHDVRSVSLEPGERVTLTLKPLAVHEQGGFIQLRINGAITETAYRVARSCRPPKGLDVPRPVSPLTPRKR